jgi:hypothetical protein
MAYVPGFDAAELPRDFRLAPGEYPIKVVLPQGAGAVTATVKVTANGLTKCHAAPSKLTSVP